MPEWKEEVRQIAREIAKVPQVTPEEIPDLEIYMDQLTTYLDKRLGFFSQEKNTPFITRSMVNNYTKARLLPPPLSKRYGPVHVMTLALICQLKRLFPIQDLGRLLAPSAGEEGTERLYRLFLSAQKESFAQTPEIAEALLPSVEGEPDADRAKAALAAQLAVRAQRDLLLAERLLDTLRPPEEPGKKKKQKQVSG